MRVTPQLSLLALLGLKTQEPWARARQQVLAQQEEEVLQGLEEDFVATLPKQGYSQQDTLLHSCRALHSRL